MYLATDPQKKASSNTCGRDKRAWNEDINLSGRLWEEEARRVDRRSAHAGMDASRLARVEPNAWVHVAGWEGGAPHIGAR